MQHTEQELEALEKRLDDIGRNPNLLGNQQAIAIRVNNLWFYKIDGEHVKNAWSLSAATLFYAYKDNELLSVIKELEARKKKYELRVVLLYHPTISTVD